jgi:hypothetical protein
MWLQTSAGTWVQVSAVEHSQRTQRVYNLSIEGVRTYHVFVGGQALLVHNDGADECKIEPNGNRSTWTNRDRVEGPAPKYVREKQYKSMKTADRRAALNAFPTCVYCGAAPTVVPRSMIL